ncbi:hypothetical protein LLE49_19495 [Alicyclobacillus tolerans]|uniref:phage adaptor protein n=1 Tax=Alicyclobacillus tolerans TaxID=90970 RepID=UPI001F3EC161|nr:hypothetical protein [Alicyclobacillus tolerans]MCF8566907.1 hypothetical protein [Alicyclobacillus tolerans]
MNQSELITEFRTQIRDVVAVPWAPTTAYTLGQKVLNGGNTYQCVAAGTSAASGGPTGTTPGIVDGSVTWNYVGSVALPALTDAEITQFITDGFRTFSKYRPRRRSTTINVVTGQTTYTLPTDWIDRDYESFNAAINPPPPVDPMKLSPFSFVSAAQLMAGPMAAHETEVQYDFYPSDSQMVITPAPQSSYDLTFDYFAYHTFDATTCTVPYLDVDNALLPGVVKGLRSIATDYSVKLQMYKEGNNIQVDDRTVAKNLQSRADELEKQFERDIIMRPSGTAG